MTTGGVGINESYHSRRGSMESSLMMSLSSQNGLSILNNRMSGSQNPRKVSSL